MAAASVVAEIGSNASGSSSVIPATVVLALTPAPAPTPTPTPTS
jgi:hypothetical protein